MSIDALLEVAAQVACLPLRCSVRMQQAGELTENAGSTLHGSWGWALAACSPALWQPAYGPVTQGAVRPLVISCPQAPCCWQAGDTLVLEISLYGEMAGQAETIIEGLQYWGKIGLGRDRCQFDLQSVSLRSAAGERLLWLQGCALSARDATLNLAETLLDQSALWSAMPQERLLVRVQSRSLLHLKENNEVVLHAPSALLFARSIARRLLSLSPAVTPELKAAVLANLDNLQQIWLLWDHTQERGLSRYSRKEQKRHQIPGLYGEWAYHGPQLNGLLPWLVLGYWLHIGSKTTFGFGAYDWQLGMQAD